MQATRARRRKLRVERSSQAGVHRDGSPIHDAAIKRSRMVLSAIRMRRASVHFTELNGTPECIGSSALCKAEAAVRSSSSRVRQSGQRRNHSPRASVMTLLSTIF